MKKNIKWIILIVIFSFILILGIILLIKEINNNHPLKGIYQENVINYIEKNNLLEEVEKRPYSKTLEEAISKNMFNIQYVDHYYEINYQERDNFIEEVNDLLNKGYLVFEINNIYDKYVNQIAKLIEIEKINLEYLEIVNFEIDNLERYKVYQEKTDESFENVITYVNIGLDKEFYSSYNVITNPEDDYVLVNKYNQLPSDYVPNDLVELNSTMKISLRVKDSITKLVEDADKEGYYLCYYSGYRSYSKQQELYKRFVSRDGVKEADKYSARPGFSEHQTGLTIDLCTTGRATIKANTKLYEWIKDNAHKYGFIIRYPQGKTNITGYQFEPWHLRHIGIEHATKVNNLDITYDEYYDLYIKER